MPRRIIVPHSSNKIIEIDGWGVFRHPPTASDSPLWVCLKIINLGAVGSSGRGHRRGRNRVLWLYWGIDARRFRRSKHCRAFEAQQPTVYAATVRWLVEEFTPGEIRRVEEILGISGLEAERARLSASRLLHEEHDRRRAAEAAAADAALDALM